MDTVEKSGFELEDFEKDIIEASEERAVLVDFWAEWCGPCRFIGPILEKLANEAGAKFKLVKINTEVHQELAAQWGIRGIPNIKMFYKGQVIGELAGALPEDQMRKWIDQNLPSKARKLLLQAQEELDKGNTEKANDLLEKSLQENPDFIESQLLLAYNLLWENPARAKVLLEKSLHLDSAVLLNLLADMNLFKEEHLEEGEEEKEQFWRGVLAFQNKDFEPAINEMLESLKTDKEYMTEIARKSIIAIFAFLGPEDELVKKYRTQFDMALY